MEDEQVRVRQLAITALAAMGDLDFVVPALSRPDDPGTRRATIAVLRETLDQSPAAAERLDERLAQIGGEEWAATVRALLVGFTPEQANDPQTYVRLVELLNHGDVGIHELALEQLQLLTGRDPLGYDPDSPEGAGLRAWQELIRGGDLNKIRIPQTP